MALIVVTTASLLACGGASPATSAPSASVPGRSLASYLVFSVGGSPLAVSPQVVTKSSPLPGVTTGETNLTVLADELGVPTASIDAVEGMNSVVNVKAARVAGKSGSELAAAYARVVTTQQAGAKVVSETHAGKTVGKADLGGPPSDDCYCWYAAEDILFILFSGTTATTDEVLAALP